MIRSTNRMLGRQPVKSRRIETDLKKKQTKGAKNGRKR